MRTWLAKVFDWVAHHLYYPTDPYGVRCQRRQARVQDDKCPWHHKIHLIPASWQQKACNYYMNRVLSADTGQVSGSSGH